MDFIWREGLWESKLPVRCRHLSVVGGVGVGQANELEEQIVRPGGRSTEWHGAATPHSGAGSLLVKAAAAAASTAAAAAAVAA